MTEPLHSREQGLASVKDEGEGLHAVAFAVTPHPIEQRLHDLR
jgi:hypothetical protein